MTHDERPARCADGARSSHHDHDRDRDHAARGPGIRAGLQSAGETTASTVGGRGDEPAGVSPSQLGGLGLDRPHPARIYDFWAGGKDHFAADRRVGARIAEQAPWVISGARGNRAFLGRAVSFLARCGIDQFLDIGTGLPGRGNVHDVAQAINPAARTVYVDHDEIVLVHARALLACDDHTIAVRADAREPATILTNPDVTRHLDFDRPIAVLLVAVLHFLVEPDQPANLITALRERLAPGSYLTISHVADLPDAAQHPDRRASIRAAAQLYDTLAAPFVLRTTEQIMALFDGFDLLPPGIVPAHQWRPRRGRPGPAIPVLAGLARLPDRQPDPGPATGTPPQARPPA